MNSREVLKLSIEMAQMISGGYLQDLTDEQLMLRPHPGCNHLNWQVGHLIAAENHHLSTIAPDAAPPLPADFAEQYSASTAASDDPTKFRRKDELLQLHAEQQAALLALLERLDDADLDRPSGISYAPTVGAVMSMQASHWLMHAGQWVVVRRALGKPALF